MPELNDYWIKGPGSRPLADERTDDFEVVVLGGYRTKLPNGQYLVYSGSDDEGCEYTVRGSTTAHGPIIEIISHRASEAP